MKWTRQFHFCHGLQIRTRNQIRVTSLSGCVPKILTLHRMSKIDFQPDFWNAQMLTFPNMYNTTMGSKVDGLAVREHFLSQNAYKFFFCPIGSHLKFFWSGNGKLQKKAFFLLKTLLLDIFWWENFSRIGPCESSLPEVSENVVLFGRTIFLTGVIAAQSQHRAAKVCLSRKISDVKKKDTATILSFRVWNE